MGIWGKPDEVESQFADILLLRKLQRALGSHAQDARRQPYRQLMQQNAGQEYDVVEDCRDLEIVGQQPADFENMLMEPAFDLAEDDEQ